MNYYRKYAKEAGFSLVEMAVVLVILGFLISALLSPLSAQREVRNMAGTQSSLSLISEALYGFAVLNGRLPCPSTEVNPASTNYGVEDATCSTSYAAEGFLPWKTLGVPEMDEWGIRRTATANPWNGYWRYRVARNFTTVDSFNTNILATTPIWGDTLMVRDSAGNDLATNFERPIAIVYSTGEDLVANGQNASYEAITGIYESNSNNSTFDDMMFWVTRPVLVNRMVTAGKLP